MQRRFRRFVLFCTAFLVALLASVHVLAAAPAPLDPKAVPEPLKPWTNWVLDGKEEALCPTFHGRADIFRCAWPSRIDLELDDHGGRFTQKWHLDARTWIPLPGDEKRWPLDVKIDGARAIVVPHDGAPSLEVTPGDRTITGSFAWDSLPESLHVPSESAIVTLSMRGAPVAAPNRDASGTVWLQKSATKEEGDALELVVHRKLVDDIPQLLTTRIELHVSGKNREELLGKALPAGFTPLSIDAQLPARLEPDGHVRTQVRPGIWVIEITARGDTLTNTFTRPDPQGLWRIGDEVWVFEAKNDYRVVSASGVLAIDPQQTTLPDAWKRLPAYPMKLGDKLSLEEKRRGDSDPPPNQLTLSRQLWLDFDGQGYTASDTITGTLERDSRLTMPAPAVLGRVSIGGKDQFITSLGDAKQTGVEIRQGHLVVNADSRITGDPSDIPAVSWAHDFHQVTGSLHLPPGWRLLHASGVDDVPGTWVKHWSLLELFLALVLAIGLGRIHGVRWGVAALFLFALTFPEDGAPKWSWLLVLALEAVHLVVPKGRVKLGFAWARAGAMAIVALIALPFVVGQVRLGMHPALAQEDAIVGAGDHVQDQSVIDGLIRSDTGGATTPEAPPPAQAQPAKPMPPNVDAPKATDGDFDDEKNGKLEEKDKSKSGEEAKKPDAWRSQTITRGGKGGSVSGRFEYSQSNAMEYDPNAIVQTGPGLPRWRWQTLDLRFSGPVAASQRLRLYLLSPAENLLLAFARALLVILVVLRFFPFTSRYFPGSWGTPPNPVKMAAAAIVLVAMLAPSIAHAQATPSKETLDELRDRLLRKPSCTPTCASSGRMAIEVRGNVLTARVDVDAKAATAVPIPGSSAQWTPAEVLVDGAVAKGLLRLGEGTLWVELAEGSHQLTVRGPMPARETFQLSLPLKPHRVEKAQLDGWTLEGVHEDGLADDNLQFTRIVAATPGAASASLSPGALPPFVRIERTLQIGLNWQVDTTVVRVSPPGAAVVLEVPLLPGENVTTPDVRVAGGKALVNMSPQATSMSWHSVLDQKSPVTLVAPKSPAWVEVWRMDVGPIWHASYEGIPIVHTEPADDVRIPTYRPWPGESVKVTLVRPDGVPGQTLTIDSSTLDVRPGLRATDATLTLGVRSSRGTEHTIVLPEGAELESLTMNGAALPVRQQGRNVTIPITPGATTLALGWRSPAGISAFFTAPAVDLGAASVNSTITIDMSSERWLLFARGPRVGPAVLFWSMLLVLAIVSVALGRNRSTPLRWWHWLLLSIGLSQVHVALAAIFVLWLLALGYRANHPGAELGHVAFNFRQAALVLFTIVALAILGVAIYQGLLGSPEMQVRGNGSTQSTLRWFSDRNERVLAMPWVMSVPLLVYRGVMLLWALFIALAIVRWLRWGFRAFSKGTAWKAAPPWKPPPQGAAQQAAYGPYAQQPLYPPNTQPIPPPPTPGAHGGAPHPNVPPHEAMTIRDRPTDPELIGKPDEDDKKK